MFEHLPIDRKKATEGCGLFRNGRRSRKPVQYTENAIPRSVLLDQINDFSRCPAAMDRQDTPSKPLRFSQHSAKRLFLA
jgi:hypothetical protein